MYSWCYSCYCPVVTLSVTLQVGQGCVAADLDFSCMKCHTAGRTRLYCSWFGLFLHCFLSVILQSGQDYILLIMTSSALPISEPVTKIHPSIIHKDCAMVFDGCTGCHHWSFTKNVTLVTWGTTVLAANTGRTALSTLAQLNALYCIASKTYS